MQATMQDLPSPEVEELTNQLEDLAIAHDEEHLDVMDEEEDPDVVDEEEDPDVVDITDIPMITDTTPRDPPHHLAAASSSSSFDSEPHEDILNSSVISFGYTVQEATMQDPSSQEVDELVDALDDLNLEHNLRSVGEIIRAEEVVDQIQENPAHAAYGRRRYISQRMRELMGKFEKRNTK